MKTNVYIDGFNLYYGCLKGTPYRWLDLAAFCRALLPRHQVHRIKYFTAHVRVQPGFDAGTTQRQGVYLRAIATLPVDVHLGHYQSHPVMAPRYPRPASGNHLVKVLKTEEKGSDVNLASHLLLDGFRADYEQAVVISNDADLATPIRMVRDELKLSIGVIYPCSNPNRTKSVRLRDVATFVREVRRNTLMACQLATVLADTQGTFSKPSGW